MRRRTASRGAAASSSTGWNRPLARSSSRELACGSRKRLFGVNSTSGRSSEWRAWRRSKWKYWAGVVQLAMRMFPSAPSARKRSMRALECSGPWPRSEEHTSELQSQSNLVCRLLLEKKKKSLISSHYYVHVILSFVASPDTSSRVMKDDRLSE